MSYWNKRLLTYLLTITGWRDTAAFLNNGKRQQVFLTKYVRSSWLAGWPPGLSGPPFEDPWNMACKTGTIVEFAMFWIKANTDKPGLIFSFLKVYFSHLSSLHYLFLQQVTFSAYDKGVLTERSITGPPSRAVPWWVTLRLPGVLQTTTDDDRRQRASLVWPVYCVGGPVIKFTIRLNTDIPDRPICYPFVC